MDKTDLTLDELNELLNGLTPGERISIDNLPNELYHACTGISCSKLKTFMDCPAKYKAMYIDKTLERPESPALLLGSAVHAAVLEPPVFLNDYVMMPPTIKTRRGAAWEQFKAENEDKHILSASEYAEVLGICDSVAKSPWGDKLLSSHTGVAERSYFLRCVETGMVLKCRTDYIDGDLIVDLKTARTAEPDAFTRSAIDMGYHVQDAFYRHITGAADFVFLVVEKTAPYIVTCTKFSDHARELGYLQFMQALEELNQASIFDSYGPYTNALVEMDLKPWQIDQLDRLKGVA